MTETLTTPAWQALWSEAVELERQVWALKQRSGEMHCPFRLNDDSRCMFDAGHEGEHKLPEWAWRAPSAK